ncbi:MAG: hypothetical protein Q4A09_06325 [Capnocytophaga felis]|nr:hypothetical protein [Capnocytophaga felis]
MATIYFKTEKTSETGKKFQALLDRAKAIREEINAFCKEQGGTGAYIYSSRYAFSTGIISVKFPEDPDPKIWKQDKKFNGYYSPRRNCKKGKNIVEKMENIPKIETEELNAIIGIKECFFGTIGYVTTNEEYFAFESERDWVDVTDVPEDCQEITLTEYEKLSLNE